MFVVGVVSVVGPIVHFLISFRLLILRLSIAKIKRCDSFLLAHAPPLPRPQHRAR
jgi:hypothetical protein